MEATSGPDSIEVQVTTTSPTPPNFWVFPLREPDRVVMDMPDFIWKPGLTAHLPSASSSVQQIRIGQVSLHPPVTRVVFDLTEPARPLRYRAASSTAAGNLRFELTQQPGAPADDMGWLALPSSTRWNPRTAAAPPKAAAVAQDRPAPTAPRPIPYGRMISVASEASAPKRFPAARQEALSAPPSPRPVPPAAWDDPAIRFAAAVGLIALTGIAAIWARRRFQHISEGGASPRSVPLAQQEDKRSGDGDAGETSGKQQGDLIRCKVVDGYLVLAPEGDASAVGGTARARVEEGTLEVDFSGAPQDPPLGPAGGGARLGEVEAPPDVSSGDEPDTATRVGDLVASLADDSIAVRSAAAEGLLEIAVAGHWSVLRPYLRSSDPEVRSVVAGILGDAGAVDCLPDVVRLSDDPDASVRTCVMYALARYGESAASCAGPVRGRLSDDDSGVRAGAVEALAALLPGSEDTADEIGQFTADPDPQVRQAAATAMFGFAMRGVAGPLIELLGDFARRAQALELLQQADDAVLWRLLLAARTSTSTRAQAAMDTLSYVMSRRWTADDFREEIESPDPEERLTGVEGLSIVGGPEAMSHLRRLAQADPSPQVRSRAADILAQHQALAGTDTTAQVGAESLRTEV